MFTGTLIEELMATVEKVNLDAPQDDSRELQYLYAMAPLAITQTVPSLLGVA